MKRFTKVLSLFLAFIMLVSLLPLAAFAGNLDNESHIVQFKLNYNGAKKLAAQKVSDGECAVEPEDAVRTGWILEYWYQKTDSGIQKYDFSKPVTEDLTLYARWKEDITYWGPIWNRNIQRAISAENNDDDTEETQYSVTFEANGDNVNNLPAAQYVSEGNCAEEPDAPTREGYLFLGWSAETNGILYNFDTEVTGDITLYALWAKIGDSSSAGSENGGSSVYSITGLTVQEDSVSVTANAVEECRLVVVFYADDDEMNTVLATAAAVVPAGIQMEAVEAQITDSLPEYFIAVAQLFDSKNEALCNTYTCIEYTRSYEEYAAKTIHDFPGKTVLNFDESSDNNFGVLAEGIVEINSGYTENVLLESSDDQYVLKNPSHNVLSLNSGDKVLITDIDSTVYLFKIASVSYNDSTVIFTVDTDNTLVEFYDYLKVDKSIYAIKEQDTPQTFERTLRLTIGENENITQSIELAIPEIKLGMTTFNFGGKATLKSSLIIQYDVVLFGENYFRFDLVNNLTGEIKAEVSLEAGNENDPKLTEPFGKEIALGRYDLPFGIPALTATAQPVMVLTIESKAYLKGTITFNHDSGFKYNTTDGYQAVDNKFTDADVNVGGEIKIAVGPRIDIGLAFLGTVFEAKAGIQLLGVFKGEAIIPFAEGGYEIHCCNVCVDGSIDVTFGVDFKLDYGITKELSGTALKIDLVKYTWHIWDFYVSLLNEPDSIFKGEVTFGIGECPNNKYLTHFSVVDDHGNKINNITVEIKDHENNPLFADNTPCEIYLIGGNYSAFVIYNAETYTKEFEITKGNEKIIIYVGENINDPFTPSDPSDEETTVWDGSIASGFAGGSGTEDDPYIIEKAAQLAYLSSSVNAVYKGNTYEGKFITLVNDIYLNDLAGWENWDDNRPENIWTPIGNGSKAFKGTFDGDNHIIYGMYTKYGLDYQGVFGHIEGNIKNLGIKQSYAEGHDYTGAIAGYAFASTISNCYNEGYVEAHRYVGGIVGGTAETEITYSRNIGTIYGGSYVGGIVGRLQVSEISRCFNTGNIFHTASASDSTYYVGGICGWAMNSDINNCYNSRYIRSTHSNTYVGGIAGGLSNSSIRNSYNDCTGAWESLYTGVVGAGSDKNSIINVYYHSAVNDVGGGTRIDLEDFDKIDSFAGFDFENIWTINPTASYAYPTLINNPHVE